MHTCTWTYTHNICRNLSGEHAGSLELTGLLPAGCLYPVPCQSIEVRWDPCTAYEFTAVGAQASISFWVVEEELERGKYQLKVCISVLGREMGGGGGKVPVEGVQFGHLL